ncbi:hypothetical protein OIU84_009884 [Salix udensis]|uniref:DYW domain-containing protein n=1 Tax=Salix udensis TaxID=889485 RepID=A0AAD6JJG5_9ROSI|nr:hypothetical protein OIU84_009884 [Salix udensis]
MHSPKEIYEMVDEMGKEMKRAGYIPTTTEVLLDIDDEDKEDTLNRHSEKLAIAFALLNTPPGTLIRIVKNLRICDDCHSATKFISKIYNREIVEHFNMQSICLMAISWITHLVVAYTVGGTYGLQHQDENAAGMSSSFCSHVSAFFSL